MKNIRILGFAEDSGPKNQIKGIFAEVGNFKNIEVELIENGDEIDSVDFTKFDAVLLGLRALDQTNVERVIDAAYDVVKLILVVDDIYNAGFRLSSDYAKKCSIVRAFPEAGYENAYLNHGYDVAFYAEMPIHWRDLYLQASGQDAIELKPKGGPLVLYAGGKFSDLNNRIIQACTRGLPESAYFTYGMHPDEKKTITESQIKVREGLVSGVRYIDKGKFSTAQMMGIADLVIFADGSTLTIGGALAQKSMIFYYDDQVRGNLVDIGAGDSWFMADLGCMFTLEGVDQLAEAIPKLLLDENLADFLRERQAQAFPLPEKWSQGVDVLNFIVQHVILAESPLKLAFSAYRKGGES